jgi:Na+/H+-dicarboxylate symporter
MYAVIVAIDWLLDRFRTALNVSGDLFAVAVITEMTGITDADDTYDADYAKPRRGDGYV